MLSSLIKKPIEYSIRFRQVCINMQSITRSKRGNKTSNLVIGLSLHIRQNRNKNLHVKNGYFEFKIFKILQQGIGIQRI